jgi:hypothetical protein
VLPFGFGLGWFHSVMMAVVVMGVGCVVVVQAVYNRQLESGMRVTVVGLAVRLAVEGQRHKAKVGAGPHEGGPAIAMRQSWW